MDLLLVLAYEFWVSVATDSLRQCYPDRGPHRDNPEVIRHILPSQTSERNFRGTKHFDQHEQPSVPRSRWKRTARDVVSQFIIYYIAPEFVDTQVSEFLNFIKQYLINHLLVRRNPPSMNFLALTLFFKVHIYTLFRKCFL